jgi:uncharacterized protein
MLMNSVRLLLLATALAGGLAASPASPIGQPRPWKVAPRLADAADLAAPCDVKLEGFLGWRITNNQKNRLLSVDTEALLAGFRQKPGSHPWIGEHIGKWLQASVLAWSYTGDEELKARIDRVVTELIKTQESDGYLGTYVPAKRFGLYPEADWDVWVHKYCLVGLLTYHQFTGNEESLQACRRIGDLLVRTFGPGPDRKSILAAGTHVGMAATSVLEPMVLLYRATGDDRYLEFARYLVAAWDEPNGPRVRDTLLKTRSVTRTANGKAYEMLSNLVGLCELARATGDPRWMEPALIAWQDIVSHRLYLTGSASQGEHFREDHYLPNGPDANVAETCVTVTWIQLNAQLMRLTGQSRFGDELEKTFLNHLAAAQRPDGAQWCYFTPLEGTKPYGPGVNCCVSSGPRGMAMAPATMFLRVPGRRSTPDTIAINTFESAKAAFEIGGRTVALEQFNDGTRPGTLSVTLHLEQPATFGLKIRTPEWARPLDFRPVAPGGEPPHLADGWTVLPPRSWKEGDRLLVSYTIKGRLVTGEHGNAGKAALTYGPFVLAYDESYNRSSGPYQGVVLAPESTQAPFRLKPGTDQSALFDVPIRTAFSQDARNATFVFFADAGSQGGRYAVWVGAPGAQTRTNASGLELGSP